MKSYTINTADPDNLSHAIGDASEKMLTDLTPVDHGALAFGLLYTYNTLKTAQALGDTSNTGEKALNLLEMIFDFAKVKIPGTVTLTPQNDNESH